MNHFKNNALALLAAFIWGTAFVAQSKGAELFPALTFNAVRSLIAVFALLAAIWVFAKVQKKPFLPATETRKTLLLGGLCCGTVLAVSSALQQMGLSETEPGKAGFITALYIVLVPILGIFLKKKAPATVWVAVVVAAVGLYYLCIRDSFTIERGDFLILLCALCFSVHILVVDHFTQKVDGMWLSCIQFAVVAVLSALYALFFEQPNWGNFGGCIIPLLYTGVLSSGIAYTLQIISQKGSNPTVISLIMSLESVFSVLAGALVLSQWLTGRELLGCGLMLAAVILAQLPPIKLFKNEVLPNE